MRAVILYPDGCDLFHQDNAPAHSGRLTVEWMSQNVPLLIKVPPHSQDLNAIELVWGILKTRIEKCQPRTRKDFILSKLSKLSLETVQKCINHVKGLLSSIIAQEGEYSKK